MPALSIKAPGKTILFGEHSVVYGYPAIAVPINSIQLNIKIFPSPKAAHGDILFINKKTHERSHLKDLPPDHYFKQALGLIQKEIGIDKLPSMEIHIQSTIPVAAGLGSSAAFAVALSRSVLGFLGFNTGIEEINQLAYEIEKIQHGTPSGVDNTVIAYNKPIYYRKNHPGEFIDIMKPVTFVIADSGIRVPTKETVRDVSIRYQGNKKYYSRIFQQIGVITKDASRFLSDGNNRELGLLMNQNHSLLQDLGVSGEALDNLVNTANHNHALGAKLCGSGKGGSIVAIVRQKDAKELRNVLLSAGAELSFTFRLEPTIESK
jgi:mevalonate kinase